MEEEKKDKGFVVRDRRFSAESGASKPESKPAEETKTSEEKAEKTQDRPADSQQQRFYPEINFSNFVVSLSSSALLHFGDIADPITNKVQRDLAAAKQTIDILGMLQEKTKGNLDDEEKRLIDGILFELRMRYVKEKDKG